METERKLTLLEDVLLQASTTALEEKQYALARVLANAAIDDALLDEAEVLMPLLRNLEAPHVQVLGVIAKPRPGEGQLKGFEQFGGITQQYLVTQFPGSVKQ